MQDFENQATKLLGLTMAEKYWRITYCPSFIGPGVVEWVYKGTEDQLTEWLNTNCGCSCKGCTEEPNWWRTANASEYIIEEIENET